MKTTPLNLSIPLDDAWDVIVAGGGPAGSAAATAAARQGARTLLIEGSGCLGGMATAGLVPAWCPFTDGEKIIYRGLAERVFTECKAAMPHVRDEIHGWLPLDPERLKRIYDNLVTSAGAQVLFHTTACAVQTRDRDLTAVVTAGKAGLAAFGARVFVDATGDADLCAWAGAPFEKGDARGETQPATLCFILSNVNTWSFHFSGRYRGCGDKPWSPTHQIMASGRYKEIPDLHLCPSVIGPGTVGFNAGHIWDVDSACPASVSKAMMEGRRIAAAYRDALAEFDPETFGAAYLAATAPVMGIRESRRIVGDYTLTLDDYLARRSFDDEIGRNCYLIDIHTAKAEIEGNRKGHSFVAGRYEAYKTGESHGIPYRCLLPKTLRNVLAPGRAISCERPVQGSARVMPACLAMGEAAGAAAALAARQASPNVHAVPPQELRSILRQHGAWLP